MATDDEVADERLRYRPQAPINWTQAATTLACLGIAGIFAFQWSLNTRITAIETRNTGRIGEIATERSDLRALQAVVERNSNRLTQAEGIDANRARELAEIRSDIGHALGANETCSNTIASLQSTLRYLEDEVRILKNEQPLNRFGGENGRSFNAPAPERGVKTR